MFFGLLVADCCCAVLLCGESAKDTRPLTADWTRLVGPIDKAEMCYSEEFPSGDNERYLDFVSLNPEQTYKYLEADLVQKAWEIRSTESDSGDYLLSLTRDGYWLDIQVTQDLDTGWARMQLSTL